MQEDFVDSYANLTVKSLMMLKWFSQSCSDKALYLMKTDDDMYVNLVNLYDMVKTNKDPYLMTGWWIYIVEIRTYSAFLLKDYLFWFSRVCDMWC